MFDAKPTPTFSIDRLAELLKKKGAEPRQVLDTKSMKLRWTVDVSSVALILGYDAQVIRDLCESGELSGYRSSSRRILIWLDSLIDYQQRTQEQFQF